jgi:hypothetical protein
MPLFDGHPPFKKDDGVSIFLLTKVFLRKKSMNIGVSPWDYHELFPKNKCRRINIKKSVGKLVN